MRMTKEWWQNWEAKRSAQGKPEKQSGETMSEFRESQLHNLIALACKTAGWLYFHGSTAHRTYRTEGEPDFTIMIGDGKVLFVEVKTGNGKLSTEQQGVIHWAEKLGVKIHVVRSIEEFWNVVNERKNEH